MANNPTAHPSDRKVCQAVNLSEPSVRQAVNVLLEQDILFKDECGVVRVLDPAFKNFINML